MKFFVLGLSIFVVLLLFGCLQATVAEQSDYSQKCINQCKMIKDNGTDLSSGPCLGLIATDWVCDVAHTPRLAVDNLPANQCVDFANGKAHHFVEVDEACAFINSQ